jgi:hypothetical protein
MSFLLRHKVLSLFLVLAVVYFFVNPSGRFGMTFGRVVIYNRIPIGMFDVYIDTQNRISIVGNAAKREDERRWFSELFEPVLSGVWNKPGLLLVGTGFSQNPSYTLNEHYRHAIEYKGITVEQLRSTEALKRYNRARDEKKAVAILLRVKP